MSADGLVRAVRGELGRGRLLPLGGPLDGVWIAERAAVAALREAERAVPGVRIGAVRVGLADPDAHDWSAVRVANPAAPPSALPYGPLRVEAEFAASWPDASARPLPRTAEEVRTALSAVARDRLGLVPAVIDLRVSGLLDGGDDGDGTAGSGPAASGTAAGGAAPVLDSYDDPTDADAVVHAVLAVPGVCRAASLLPGPDVRVRIAVTPGHRALDVALAVRAVLGPAEAGRTGADPEAPPAAAVLVTDV